MPFDSTYCPETSQFQTKTTDDSWEDAIADVRLDGHK